jgi:hypothetical protein
LKFFIIIQSFSSDVSSFIQGHEIWFSISYPCSEAFIIESGCELGKRRVANEATVETREDEVGLLWGHSLFP